jgi:dTDP-4-dehydrorhamnose reductase
MRILVTGRTGQVARSLVERGSASKAQVVPLGRPQLDLAEDPRLTVSAIASARPDVIVSAGAYTEVDKGENEREAAFTVNQGGAAAVAAAAKHLDVPLIHLSTDYVFDGTKSGPYTEEDATGPASVYGASKLAGEEAVLAEHANSVVLRTAWIYSPFGSNFVRTMLRLARAKEEVAVVSDQRGNPTSALDIADAILVIAANLISGDELAQRGIFHLTATGDASWAEFATAIFELSAKHGGPEARVRPITTAEYPTAAVRPANSRLNSDKLARLHGVRLGPWQSSLEPIVRRLLQPGQQEL